ncbi:glycoside hydrolase family 2 protein [Alginatibacterium sediminis]|uniref:beta-mannosidase n=1 Tax=Alginatibacterium sediminis TaxID=2164068 RepID=A0A420ED12_9ALTE|nr:glycoside hydrolase family 2 protein [Alginatibacterium sediminis]RKF18544.1 glycoside hydrolase family 2 protein [Alginatibacterium sediminis]
MTSSTLNLDGTWLLRNLNGEQQCDFTLPGDVFSALLAAELIPDPYFAENEHLVRWVGETDWEISKSFNVDPHLLEGEHVFLELNRVDTMADVFVNDTLIQSCSNSFTRYRPELKSSLVSGENTIRIVFKRIDKIALERAQSMPYPVPFSAGDNNTVPHMNTVRKTQCHAGWDWGITLMTSGVYESVFIQSVHNQRIDYLTNVQRHSENGVEIEFSTKVFIFQAGEFSLDFSFNGQQKRITRDLEAGEHSIECVFNVEQPKLWWPVGFGDAHLYPVEVSSLDGQSIQQNIGLRELVVDNSRDEIGKRLTILVNGIEIFCKGANWIPSDALISRQTEAKHRGLLEDAVAANMNMIRVWGGGQYEYDHFYDICDELGLLVWQDAMFACSQYPSLDWFLEEVGEELKHQTQRLSHHCGLALWCGDNEVIGSLTWYDESKNDPLKYSVNYDRLNHFIDQSISKYDPQRMFWPSSPCNGPMDFGGWHDDTSGDMHFWNVWHSGESFDAYYSVRPRFCSEFGFQSFSSLPSTKEFLPEGEFNVTAPAMEHHQKNNRGNSIITEMFTRLFRMPSSFEQQLYLSQVQQAMAMGVGIEYWRSTRPVCMGTLYWQLNDNWPVASWSSIEYNGRWKQLHYHVCRSYNPVMVTAYVKDQALQIWGVNDQAQHAEVFCQGGIYDLNGKLLVELPEQSRLEAGEARCLFSLPQSEWLDDVRERFVLVRYQGMCQGKVYEGERLLFLTEPKRVALPAATINHRCVALDDGKIEVQLSSNKPAFYVTLEVDGDTGVFDDNSINLSVGETRNLVFTPRQGISLESFTTQLRIYDLANATMA